MALTSLSMEPGLPQRYGMDIVVFGVPVGLLLGQAGFGADVATDEEGRADKQVGAPYLELAFQLSFSAQMEAAYRCQEKSCAPASTILLK